MPETIAPHGGRLIDRRLQDEEMEEAERKAAHLRPIHLDERELSDLEMIAVGVFSPLEGFMDGETYQRVLQERAIAPGLPWTIPITLAPEEGREIKMGEEVVLVDREGRHLALMKVEDKFRPDISREAKSVYRTEDRKHPGVDYLYRRGDTCLGGPIWLLQRPTHTEFVEHRLDPAETRRIFHERGWRTVVGFQTRNPIHRAHEYIQKCALEIVEGLFINPIVGFTRASDIPVDLRMRCYEVILDLYYPKERVLLGVLETAMRYAGPMEAIFHAIMRKNFGCTHIIIGRDHAGVGDYYGTFGAQHIFREFDPAEIGITPLFYDNAFYCKACGGMATPKTCPHPQAEHIVFSGTRIREMLRAGEKPPPEFSRPEVVEALVEGLKGRDWPGG